MVATVDGLVGALDLDRTGRVKLHQAADLGVGFKLDLPDDF
ncbi:hypothetical protein O4G76_07015 [Limimaricola sp. G21655-S1]|nr:hypothetical protein [Limimaricola sp. G21655-S1]MCZ4260590.1 hypothetical protein [Limimaricola sp. G21655-S1]